MRTLFAVLALFLSAVAASAVERTITIEVTGLTCPSCPYIASQAIESVESAQVIDGEYNEEEQLAVFIVTYDDELTTAEEVAAAPAEYGYEGRILDAATES